MSSVRFTNCSYARSLKWKATYNEIIDSLPCVVEWQVEVGSCQIVNSVPTEACWPKKRSMGRANPNLCRLERWLYRVKSSCFSNLHLKLIVVFSSAKNVPWLCVLEREQGRLGASIWGGSNTDLERRIWYPPMHQKWHGSEKFSSRELVGQSERCNFLAWPINLVDLADVQTT